jgi:dUTP pyrophosphatase
MILIAPLDEKCIPERSNWTDAGLDLKAAHAGQIDVGGVAKVRCGIKVEIEPGYVGLILPRSGIATKKGIILSNTVGIIDSDYRGEIMCFMRNTGSFEYKIAQYERIAQLIVVPCGIGDFFIVNEDELSKTGRGDSGFGSTGK